MCTEWSRVEFKYHLTAWLSGDKHIKKIAQHNRARWGISLIEDKIDFIRPFYFITCFSLFHFFLFVLFHFFINKNNTIKFFIVSSNSLKLLLLNIIMLFTSCLVSSVITDKPITCKVWNCKPPWRILMKLLNINFN